VFEVVLQGASSFLLVSRQLLGEVSSIRSRYNDLLHHCWYGLMHRVSYDSGVVAIGVVEVTTLHVVAVGEPELSPSLEVESSSLGDSSRIGCSDGNLLWAIPLTIGVVPLGQQTQVIEVVGNELKVLEADVLVSGELDAKQGDAASGGGRFT
jgi:hypothetical protein